MSTNRVVFFSGGKSSFAVCDWVKENYPDDNIILYFTDTLVESADVYRFIFEASNKLGLPLLIHSRGLSPAQLMVKQKFLANNRVSLCSQNLKMKVAADFLIKGKKPEVERWYNKQFLKLEDFLNPVLYMGIGFYEQHRVPPIKANWPYDVQFPLIDHIIDSDEVLKKYDIVQPDMYFQNFSHANCGGKCVRAGAGHFKNLLMKRENDFQEFKEQEIVISEYIRYTKQSSYSEDRDYLYDEVWDFVSTGKKTAKLQHIIDTHKYTKNWNFGGRNKPYTFMKNHSLADIEQRPIQIDMFDIAGCGCMFDYSDTTPKELVCSVG